LDFDAANLSFLECEHTEPHAGEKRIAQHPEGLVGHVTIVAEPVDGGKRDARSKPAEGQVQR